MLQDWATVPEIAREEDLTPVSGHPVYGLPYNLVELSRQGIHFGSTETADEFGGYLEGALEAAERSAQSVLASIAARVSSEISRERLGEKIRADPH